MLKSLVARTFSSFIAVTVTVAGGALAADSCKIGATDFSAHPDRTLLFQDAEGSWKVFDSPAPSAEQKRRLIRFIYVIRPWSILGSQTDRVGVVVIKAGNYRSNVTENPVVDRVRLFRRYHYADECTARLPAMNAYVSREAYEQYYDHAADDSPIVTSNQSLFNLFNFAYKSNRTKTCIRTDDVRPPRNVTSNRSQASFHPRVVSTDTWTVASNANPFTWFSVWANNVSDYSNLKTELRRYRVKSGVGCVQFSAVFGPYSFVRVNDLEATTLPPASSRYEELERAN